MRLAVVLFIFVSSTRAEVEVANAARDTVEEHFDGVIKAAKDFHKVAHAAVQSDTSRAVKVMEKQYDDRVSKAKAVLQTTIKKYGSQEKLINGIKSRLSSKLKDMKKTRRKAEKKADTDEKKAKLKDAGAASEKINKDLESLYAIVGGKTEL
eukprot:gnl/TRDRNA2_/TRDRNA2_127899_c1_seq1.p1 gnl/TRDRNA2_/TRDRNA2_127899_c1~~gnl/TRDRNA2_/TRDRNA2_127899_c1_seq1.p1  ORF type:complete len:152 (-),score=45.02 gnl/TRDRNA2_/TRDRNA2_127899_c1_seq1:12-467(-)